MATSRVALIVFLASMTCPPLSISSAFCACASAVSELVRVEKSDEIMGATFSVVLYGSDRERLESAADAALDEAQRLDQMLSNYKPDSEWSEMNRAAARGPVKVSPELFTLLSECLRYSEQSDGAFDISVGPLMKVWGFYKGEGMLPRRESVTSALQHVGYRHVRLDARAGTVRFDRAGVELDPGGIGKGYAVDRMVAVLKNNAVGAALVSASGSSIFGMGAPPTDTRGWRITIRAPRDPHATAAEIFLKDMSIATSGGYEKFFWAEGRTYSHLIDPRTGYPAQGTASVSVLAPRAIDSEAWTKPYFINGRAWTSARRPSDFRVFLCDDTMPSTCAWVD